MARPARKSLYMDHAATTYVSEEVFREMKPYFAQKFGNASSLHSYGNEAKNAVEETRKKVADVISADASEIIFTSGGTESDNLAIIGSALANKEKGKHIITSRIEHPAVLETFKHLERNGFETSYVPVDKYGMIKIDELKASIRKDTVLISIMHANNEIGTIEPIEEIGKIAKEKGIVFHVDAVQTYGKIPIDVKSTNVDLLSVSAHKIYGPKGVGALYVRKGTQLNPLVFGGGHERGMRSGTENVAGIVGLGKAAEIAKRDMETEGKRLTELRDKLITNVMKIEKTRLNGHAEKRLPNNANFGFDFVEGEAIILALDAKGVSASTGSACSSKKLEPSHVLTAIGLKPEESHGSLRITLGRENTKESIDYLLEVLPKIISKLREMSPFYSKS